jgi:hypothetical protein
MFLTIFILFSDPVHLRLRSEGQKDHQQAGDQPQDLQQGENHGEQNFGSAER